MERYAVIGQPIGHSRSPAIHARFARQTGQDLSYEALEVPGAELQARLAWLHQQGFSGLNVTLPHKQAVAGLCLSVSARAQQAGAVNTLLRADGGWIGDNTDGEGLMADLVRLGVGIQDRRVLVLGAGGAVRGILAPLLALRPACLAVSNRNPWKPEALAEAFKLHGPVLPRTHLALKGEVYDLVINATSAGHSGAMPRLPGGLLAAGGDAYDLSYGPAHAPFAAWAALQAASRVEDGLGMLVEQAAAAFELWRGVRPQTTAVVAALRRQVQTGTDADEVVPGHQAPRRSHVELPPQD